MLQKLFISFCLLMLSFNSMSQTTIPVPDLAQVGFPSPEAMRIQKYGNYPVNYSTGVPSISIPLYVIKGSRLTLPVEFNYHSSGFKPADGNGTIGLGWSINAGGRISRTVFGKTDELNPSPSPVRLVDTMNMQYYANKDYIESLFFSQSNGQIDEEPDLFYYNTLKTNGKFVLKNNGDGTRTPVLTKFQPIKISSNTTNYSTAALDYFELIDDNGDLYRFGKSLIDGTVATESSNPDRNQPNKRFTSSWLLTEIISADKSDTISFKYSNLMGGVYRGRRTDRVTSSVLEFKWIMVCPPENNTCVNQPTGNFYTDAFDNINWSTHEQRVITEINYKYGKVVFDYNGPNGFNNDVGRNLYQVIIQDRAGRQLQKYRLMQSNFGTATSYTLAYYKMDSLQLFNANNEYINSYQFQYYNSTSSNIMNGYEENLAIDFWGYYNGATGNTTLLPPWNLTEISPGRLAGDANRESDETYMKMYMLSQIRYPTGGTTDFELEGNRIPTTSSSPHIVGGLRIKRIKNTSTTGNINYKYYKYGNMMDDESGVGIIQINPFDRENFTTRTKQYWLCKCGLTGNVKNAINQITTYSSDFTDGSGAYEAYPIFYSNVAEYDGYDEVNNNGKTVYYYSIPANVYTGGGPTFRHMSVANDWFGGELLKKTIFKNTGGSFSSVQMEEYAYLKRQTDDVIGTKVTQFVTGNDDNTSPYAYESLFYTSGPIAFNKWNYHLTTGINQLVQKKTTDYTLPGNMTRIEDYGYSNFHNYPIQISTTTSDQKSQILNNKYPPDITFTSGIYETARQQQVNKNIISPLIQSKLTVGGIVQNLVQNNYKDFGYVIPLKESIQQQILNNPIETRIQFSGYDSKGNLLTQNKYNDKSQSIIWDYQSGYPIAIVDNALQADIAATSFESDGKGNWSFSGAVVGNPLAFSGLWSYNLTVTTPITKAGLTSAKVYRLSYWTRNATAFTIAGTQSGYPITGPSRNGWNYFEHKITGVTSVSISGTGILDELRLLPVDAQMVTYTYLPTIGISSQCDANNTITYYEYDGLQRLQLIRDQDRNIVKKYSYNYSGQVINDNIFYNAGKSVSVKKLNTTCSACQIGSTVTYIVPANKYSASSQPIADQLEQAEIDANAQNYANSFGSCSVATAVPISGTNGISSYSFSLQFHNNCTGSNYNFTLNASATNVSLSGVPEGNYTVTLSANGAGSTQFTYKVNGFTQHAVVGSITLDLQTGGNQVLITP